MRKSYTTIKKSRNGKIIVHHKSSHYHKLFSNVLIRRDIANSGNMFRRDAHSHFLNTRMASYAVPSFQDPEKSGQDILEPYENAQSGILCEIDSGVPLSVHLNLCRLAHTDSVRYVQDGVFYKTSDRNHRYVEDRTMPRRLYPMGIYYGWFKIRVWVYSKKHKKGLSVPKMVRGWLVQKRDNNALCGRIVYHNSVTGRKRTDNTYSRETEYPAETDLKYSTRCKSKSFIPERPCIYIPFSAYNALPYMMAYIPTNYPSPLSHSLNLNTNLSLSYKKRSLYMYTGTISGEASNNTSTTIQNPTNRVITITTPFEVILPEATHNIILRSVRNELKQVKAFFYEHSQGTVVSFPIGDFISLLETLEHVSLKILLNYITSDKVKTQIRDAVVKYTSDMESYLEALKNQQQIRDPSKMYTGDPILTSDPLYVDGVQVRSKVVETLPYEKISLKVFYDVSSYTYTGYNFDSYINAYMVNKRTLSASLPPVSSLHIGGKTLVSDLSMSSPSITIHALKIEGDGDEEYPFNGMTGNFSVKEDVIDKILKNKDDPEHPNCILRVSIENPNGDYDVIELDQVCVIFVNKRLSEKYGLDENTRYISFYNTSGTQIWSEYENTWSRAVHDVNTEWSKVFIENDPTIEEVDFESTLKYTKIFFQRIKDVVEGYKYNDDNDEVPRMSDTMRAEIDYLMSSRSIQKMDIVHIHKAFIVKSGFHKGLFDNETISIHTDESTGKRRVSERRVTTTVWDTSSGENRRKYESGFYFTQWMTKMLNPVPAGIIDLSQDPVLLDHDLPQLLKLRFGPYPLHQNIGDPTFGNIY